MYKIVCSTHFTSHVLFELTFFRACITGSENTLAASVLLDLIQNWMFERGSFTYTYPSNEEVETDPDCPVEIESFNMPECGTGKSYAGLTDKKSSTIKLFINHSHAVFILLCQTKKYAQHYCMLYFNCIIADYRPCLACSWRWDSYIL